jgi:hypothetical protein
MIVKTINFPISLKKHITQITKRIELIIFCVDDNYKLQNYNELCIRFITNNFLLLFINNNKFKNNTFNSIINNNINKIQKDIKLKFNIIIDINYIYLICHKNSCNNIINLSLNILKNDRLNKIIFLNPVLTTNKLLLLKNIYNFNENTKNYINKISIIVPSDKNVNNNIINIINFIGNNVYILNNIKSNNFNNLLINNYKETNKNNIIWDNIFNIIIDIIHNKK